MITLPNCRLFIVGVSLLLSIHVVAQDISLDDIFEEYEVGELKLPPTTNLKSETEIRWKVTSGPLKGEEIYLYENELISSEYRNNIDVHLNLPHTYSGYLLSDPTRSKVRLTRSENKMMGYVRRGTDEYFVEPVTKLIGEKSNQHVWYQSKDVKNTELGSCIQNELERKRFKAPLRNYKSSSDCRLYELAIATDYEYAIKHGGPQGAMIQSTNVMNMVAGDYDDVFSEEIRFEIVEHWISTSSNANPWGGTIIANELLTNFNNWSLSDTGFTAGHDLGQLWTTRDLCSDKVLPIDSCGVIGFANIAAICGPGRYQILEDNTSNNATLRVLVSHETGHNFGGRHDNIGSFIMSPQVSTTGSWSNSSTMLIDSFLSTPLFDCFDPCVIGSCSEILSTETSNCNNANSTHTLTIVVRHGGGGSSTSFDLNIDGIINTYSWLASPQTIVINGLSNTGASSTITISANDGSDTDCNATDDYESPPADCSLSIFEDFTNENGDCELPESWSNSTTNTLGWPSGFEYLWKGQNEDRTVGLYGQGNNSYPDLTINGSCMALMDDDIGGPQTTQYTGVTTLTTATIDGSIYDAITLEFDYIFHEFENSLPFEIGKTPNNSFFEVQVFDGNSWISLLVDDSSSCSWIDVWANNCISSMQFDLTSYLNASLTIRFIYSDGEDGAWAGMAAIDNVKITGIASPPSPCDNIVILTQPITETTIEAGTLINTSGAITINQNLSLSAPNVELDKNVTVSDNIMLTIDNDGCN